MLRAQAASLHGVLCLSVETRRTQLNTAGTTRSRRAKSHSDFPAELLYPPSENGSIAPEIADFECWRQCRELINCVVPTGIDRSWLTIGPLQVSAFLSWRLQATNACDVTLVWKAGFERVSQYGISFKYETLMIITVLVKQI